MCAFGRWLVQTLVRTGQRPNRRFPRHLRQFRFLPFPQGRLVPSLPVVTGAVRRFPLASIYSASRSPLRTMVFAPSGSGFVTVFLNTVPIVSIILY